MLALRLWRMLYRLLLIIAWPWVHVRLRLRQRTEADYGDRIDERFARLPAGLPAAPVWFHTVSAGEIIAAAPLIGRLAAEFPEIPFLVTTMTPTGSAQVRKLLDEQVAHCYVPYDFPHTVRRFFDQLQPRMLVLMETELWPNMLRIAAARQVPALLVNARLSERSAKGYARIGALSRSMLESLEFVGCQYPDHAERFLALGARPERLAVLGSVKFDVTLPSDHEARVKQLRDVWQLANRPVWIAGSTHSGEDSIVLDAHQRIQQRFPGALLILVPRHPSRSEEVAGLVAARGLHFERLSAGSPSVSEGHFDLVLGDTMGDLLYLYGLSQIAFLGGSLVSAGGHNPIEAAVCAQPLVMGPETFNFPDVVAAFSDAGCLHLVTDAQGLSAVVGDYFADSAARRQKGFAAARVVEQNRGATDRLLDLLRAQLRAVS